MGDVDIRNLKFFLNVLQAKALHEKIIQICCVSVMVNSLEISPSTYNTLYKHLDNLIRQKVSNFACFLCNMIFMNGKEVEEHVLTLSHSEKKAIWTSRMQDQPGPKAAILCADCDILIDDDITDKHKDHHLPDTERVPAKQIKRKKKEPVVAPVVTETFIPTERMLEEDEDDPEEEDDEEVEIDDKDDDDWEMD